eukprot:g41302.t1
MKKCNKTVLYSSSVAYRQKLKWEKSSRKEVQCWSEAVEDGLRDSLDSVDWTVFKRSAENPDKFATTVTNFITKHVEGCAPKKSIRVFPNQKPWMNQEIHSLLKTR